MKKSTHDRYDTINLVSNEISKTNVPFCHRISNRCKFLFLVSIIIIQALVIVTYNGTNCRTATVAPKITPCEQTRTLNSSNNNDLLTKETIDESHRLPHEKHARRRLPHFIVIGVKKCGTRALLKFLSIHPDIVVSGPEVHFFDDNEMYSKGLEYYRKEMPFSNPDQLTGEKSPSYYRYKEVPERIHMMNNSIKLIMIVREPIERSMSNYLQSKGGSTDYMTFEEAVFNNHGEVNPESPLIFNSDYSLYIDNWLQYFDRKQMKIVDGNLLIKSPHVVMEDLQDFLGIRQYITRDSFKYVEKKGFYCVYKSSNKVKCLGKSKGRPHPAMDPNTVEKLKRYFRPKNELFFQRINKTFDWF